RRENLTPLERYDLGQLKLVGIVWDVKEPNAMIEDSVGLGYIVKIGTPIGMNDGRVKAIRPGEVVVEETYTDIYGARKKRDVSMTLHVEKAQ
ncbi:MAG TPA: pilus assembly protein PilP, partial [Candidatus Eisenbacteria bacterium]|nr:pilus assembly protein PilP [Candidatus Eisenbacteria bacterium]